MPLVRNLAELAEALEIAPGALRRLTGPGQYRRFQIPKKSGGSRRISAPLPALARAQRWILRHLLEPLPLEPAAHGFAPGRSIVSNAAPHAGRAVVVNLDLKDFFPSIGVHRVRGLFRALGHGEPLAAALALLCTEPTPAGRTLPQGACTSPAITNALCRRLDRRLSGLACSLACAYTRYADDLTFSGEGADTGRLLGRARAILTEEGFALNHRKTRIMHQWQRQTVTGLTVNAQSKAPRKELRALRALLHNIGKHGLESQNHEGRPDFEAFVRGKVAYANMVETGLGAA